MAFSNGAYATVKRTAVENGRLLVHLITSKKGQDGKYHCDFSSRYIVFVGKARDKEPLEGDRIKILQCAVENAYINQDDEIIFLKNPKYIVFDYEFIEHWDDNKKIDYAAKTITDDDLPF